MNLLVSENISLRALEPDDAELLYQWENDTTIWKAGETITPISRYIINEYLKHAHKDIYETKQLRLIIQFKEPVGAIDLFDFDPYHMRAGIGILIAGAENRRKGYAKTALSLVIRYSFEILQLHQLYCNINADNTASIALFTGAGFEVTGTRKEWIKDSNGWMDELFLQLIRQPKSA